ANLCLMIENLAAEVPSGNDRAKELLLKKAELEAEREAWTPFDVRSAPLLRVRLLRLAADDYILLLTLHHIIVDGWSIGIFLGEVSELYAAITNGRPTRLPEPVLRFSDFARWQRSWCATASADQQFAYWRERLREATPVFRRDDISDDALLFSPIDHEPV